MPPDGTRQVEPHTTPPHPTPHNAHLTICLLLTLQDQDEDGPVAHFWLIMTADALCSCGLFIALSVGPRYISGAEVALIMLLEVLVGPLWLALIYADLPGTYTIIGGMSLVFFLAAHEALVLLGLAEAEDDGEEEGEGERANGEDTKGGGGLRELVAIGGDEQETQL